MYGMCVSRQRAMGTFKGKVDKIQCLFSCKMKNWDESHNKNYKIEKLFLFQGRRERRLGEEGGKRGGEEGKALPWSALSPVMRQIWPSYSIFE
jgi:hypothetical protein